MAYLSIDELMTLWRPLKQDEMERARALIDKVEANLKVEAKRVSKDIDELVNCPSLGASPSSSFVNCSILDIVAFHLSIGSAV